MGVDFLDQGDVRLDEESYVLVATGQHDWNALAAYLEAGYPLTDKLRAYLVEVLRGKKRPNHPPGKASTIATAALVAAYLGEMEWGGIPKMKAVGLASTKFGVSERTIQDIARRFQLRPTREPAERIDQWLQQRKPAKKRSRAAGRCKVSPPAPLPAVTRDNK
jgi:hypothetical protein